MKKGAILPKDLLAAVLVAVITSAGCSVTPAESPSTPTKDHQSAPLIAIDGTPEQQGIASVWQAAKQRGVNFRAVGNEPAWLLEISDADGILLVTDYGAKHYRFGAVEPETDSGTGDRQYRLQVGEHLLTINMVDAICQDSMAGIEFSTQVLVLLDGRELSGCGQSLR